MIRVGTGLRVGTRLLGFILDVTSPTRTSIATNAAGTKIIITYNEPLDGGSVPALGAFTLAGPVIAVLTGTPAIVGSTVELSVTPAINTADTGITLSYTAGGSPLQDSAGNDVSSFTTQAVTNSSTHVYTPADEGDARLAVDMNDASTLTESGGVITALTNKLTAAALTPVGSPAYQATGLNSLPTMDLNGTTQYFLGSEAAVVAAGVDAAPRTVMMVCAVDTVDRLESFFAWANSGISSNQSFTVGASNALTGRSNVVSRSDAAVVVTPTGSLQIDITAHVYSFVFSGTAIESWIDAAADLASTAMAPGTSTPNRYAIGARPDIGPDNFFDGQLSEIWVFSKALSTAARVRVQNYLKAKWGTP